MNEGWIKLYRSILDNPIFHNEKLYKVFTWCLLKASHKEHECMVGFQLVRLEKGQFITGRSKAAEELNLKPSSAWEYLKFLEKNNCLGLNSNNKFTIVTVVNWELYQSDNKNTDNEMNLNGTRNDTEMITKKTHNNTNKNVKNYKNDNNVKNDNNYLQTEPIGQSVNKDISKITIFFEQNIGLVSSTFLDDFKSFLDDGIEAEVICFAIKEAAESNKRNFKYIKGILNNWLKDGIKDVNQLEAHRLQYKKDKLNTMEKGVNHNGKSRSENTGNAKPVQLTAEEREQLLEEDRRLTEWAKANNL